MLPLDVAGIIAEEDSKFLAAVEEAGLAWLHSRPTEGRSSQWHSVRAEHLSKYPTCAACGGKDGLEVHHIEPYHINPQKELDPANLLTLCENQSKLCHLTFGHAGFWRGWVPEVVKVAAENLKRVQASAALAKHPFFQHRLDSAKVWQLPPPSTEDDKLRTRSNSTYVAANPLVAFLYELMRDHLPAGDVEALVRASPPGQSFTFTNGWLAAYAVDLAERLRIPVLAIPTSEEKDNTNAQEGTSQAPRIDP